MFTRELFNLEQVSSSDALMERIKMSIIIVYMPIYTFERDPFSLSSLSVLLSVFVRDSTNYTPCQQTTSSWRCAVLKRTAVARRKKAFSVLTVGAVASCRRVVSPMGIAVL